MGRGQGECLWGRDSVTLFICNAIFHRKVNWVWSGVSMRG